MSRMPTLQNEKRAATIWHRWRAGRDIVLMVARALDTAEKRGRSAVVDADTKAWTRGFVSAVAYHMEGTEAEEALKSAGLDTAQEACDAGAEYEDVQRILDNHRGVWPVPRRTRGTVLDRPTAHDDRTPREQEEDLDDE